ncbi:MAG: hypothetical protein FWC45_01645 [Treponema sp.]|nr:hypothetical protein [Treponema sp.]
MVKTFSWCSPLEKTKRKIETFEGEIKLPGAMSKLITLICKVRKDCLQTHIRARAS